MYALPMRQFDYFTAFFEPQRTDDLVDGAEQWIGSLLRWQAAYLIEDGPYEGEWACTAWDAKTPFAWAPFSDLVIGGEWLGTGDPADFTLSPVRS